MQTKGARPAFLIALLVAVFISPAAGRPFEGRTYTAEWVRPDGEQAVLKDDGDGWDLVNRPPNLNKFKVGDRYILRRASTRWGWIYYYSKL